MRSSTERAHIEPGRWWHSILLGVIVDPCQKRTYSVEQTELIMEMLTMSAKGLRFNLGRSVDKCVEGYWEGKILQYVSILPHQWLEICLLVICLKSFPGWELNDLTWWLQKGRRHWSFSKAPIDLLINSQVPGSDLRSSTIWPPEFY